MMILLDFLTSTLLKAVVVFFMAGTLLRSLVFIVNAFRDRSTGRHSAVYHMVTMLAVIFPYHRALLRKPVYAALRYVFHASLFIVPIWFSGHIGLWEESRLEWSWMPIPDGWADRMTLFVLIACVVFIARHLFSRKDLVATGVSDYVFISVTGLPFLTGYLLTHGNLATIPFFEKYLWYMHVISGEILLAMVAFLFCITHLKKEECVGCAACVENCPTESLEYDDKGAFRFFRYAHYQCICCGACVSVCPESAAELRHQISLKYLFQTYSKSLIRSTELEKCAGCGAVVGPKVQVDKIWNSIEEQMIELETLALCSRCKKMMASRITTLESR